MFFFPPEYIKSGWSELLARITRHGLEFAVHIIREKFGDINAKVAETLLNWGTLTLEQVTTFTALELELVKKSLLILIQHNFVKYYVEPFGSEEGEEHIEEMVYVINFDNILHIDRLPKFVQVVDEELGEYCEGIFVTLVKDGRLTLEQLAERDERGPLDADAVREALRQLVDARFVERCPSRLAPAMNVTGFVPAEWVLEEEKLEETLRFSLPAADSGKPVFWRANYEEFMRHLRRKALVEITKTKLGDGPHSVLDVILKTTKKADAEVKLAHSVPLSFDEVVAALQMSDGTFHMTMGWVREMLLMLGCKPTEDDMFSIDLNTIIEWARNQEVEAIILKRYGDNALRVFQHLSSKEKESLTSRKIAKSIGLKEADVDKSLFSLVKDQYVDMQQSPNRQIHLRWQLKSKPILWEVELERFYHGALNLKLRLAHEMKKEETKKEEVRNEMKKEEVRNEMKEETKKAEVRKELLRSKSIILDDAMLLFHDF